MSLSSVGRFIFFAQRYRRAATLRGATGAKAAGVTRSVVGSGTWLGIFLFDVFWSEPSYTNSGKDERRSDET